LKLPAHIDITKSGLEVATTTLETGLDVVAVHLPHSHRTVLEILTRVGSRFDPPGLRGISHFLEHMLYRGTVSHPTPHALAQAFERLGGSLEAATYVDHGVLSLELPTENVEQALPLFCEVFCNPVLHGIDIERAIVREEILESLADDGKLIDADELGRQLCFGDHNLGQPITGTLSELERFDVPALRAHHRERYTPQASVFCIASPSRCESILPALNQGFARQASGSRPAVITPSAQTEARFQFISHVSSQTELRLVFRSPGQHDPVEPAMELLLRVLDDGMSTRLYQRICNALGLCYDVNAYYETWQDCGVIEIAADCAHERAEALLKELLDLLLRLRDEGPTEDELTMARNRHQWQLTQLFDSPSEVASFYGFARLSGLAPTVQARLDEVNAVSLAAVRQAARRILVREGLSVVAVGQLPKRTQTSLERAVMAYK
jgi:predicted Zn-dependent peptidase